MEFQKTKSTLLEYRLYIFELFVVLYWTRHDDASSDAYDIINETLILCFINSSGGGGQLIVDSVLLETSWITSLGKKMEMLVGRLVCP